eukprot:scaffold216094_cov32-Tisochrysis_lutea.AAC.2
MSGSQLPKWVPASAHASAPPASAVELGCHAPPVASFAQTAAPGGTLCRSSQASSSSSVVAKSCAATLLSQPSSASARAASRELSTWSSRESGRESSAASSSAAPSAAVSMPSRGRTGGQPPSHCCRISLTVSLTAVAERG